jgi:ribosome-binding factor A
VSPDLSYAKVFISVLGNSVEKRQIFVWLCENVGQIRFSLGKRLKHMRRVPELIFKLSDSQATSDLISLIDELAPSKAKPSAGDYEVELTEDDDEED